MPKQDDDIFKFDPASYWQQRNSVNIVDEGKEIVKYVPAFKLEVDPKTKYSAE